VTTRPTSSTRAIARLGHRGGRSLRLAVRLDALRHRGFHSLVRQRRTRRTLAAPFATARSETYRAIWSEAADAVGAEIEPLADEFLVIRRRTAETVVRQNLVTLNDGVTMALTSDKPLVHRLLVAAGLPVPTHIEVDWRDPSPAYPFLSQQRGPFFVKPATGTGGGAGVTGNVGTADELSRVCLSVGRWSQRVLVEQAIQGSEYRLLFLDGRLLDAVRREPPAVRGDGRSTVGELLEAENSRRSTAPDQRELRAIRIDLDLEMTVSRGGYAIDSVVPAGETIRLKSAVSENARADNTTVHDLSPALVSDARRAAEVGRLRLAGVDLVTPDPSASLEEGGGAVLEVNSPPGLHYHYVVKDQQRATRVAIPILEELLAH
jgi:cyanophycin synthetase